ncbi:MAG TPA: hypothetical protein DDW50_01020 [Firmicutes bacterium]|jgi:hypothetical protein|nr:hypothetical protein [Bacillota bacterium]
MKNKTKGSPVYFLGCFLLLIGLLSLTYELFDNDPNMPQSVPHWRKIQAEVQSTQIKQDEISRGKSRFTTVYYLLVAYTYQVHGQNYQLQDVLGGDSQNIASYTELEELQSHYQDGQWIRAYYDPRHPENSRLHIGAKKVYEKSFWGAGLLIFISFGIIGFQKIRDMRKS